MRRANQTPEKAYLNVDEVARRFGVDSTTIYRLAQRGALPGFKIGGQWRFSEEKLIDWANGEVLPGKGESKFLTLVSHELRTPLAVIQEGISQIIDGVAGPITRQQRETLEMTLRNIDRLRHLVENLLGVSNSVRNGLSVLNAP